MSPQFDYSGSLDNHTNPAPSNGRNEPAPPTNGGHRAPEPPPAPAPVPDCESERSQADGYA